nr:MAG TPA: hypothetical protein [Caudoviricetes sp.]
MKKPGCLDRVFKSVIGVRTSSYRAKCIWRLKLA